MGKSWSKAQLHTERGDSDSSTHPEQDVGAEGKSGDARPSIEGSVSVWHEPRARPEHVDQDVVRRRDIAPRPRFDERVNERR